MRSLHQLILGAPRTLHTLIPPTSNLRLLAFPSAARVPQLTPPTINNSSRPLSSSSSMDSSIPESPTPIHILGLGNLGKLFAHALTTSHSPTPVTMLTHRPSIPSAFAHSNNSISILRSGTTTSTPPGLISIHPIHASDTHSITHLIVTTKAASTASAILPLVPRLSPASTIIFTQNGMGVVDEVNTVCFSDPASRPSYLTAIVVHGVFTTGLFSCTHAAIADVKIGHTPNGDASRSAASSGANELLKKIVAAEGLLAKEVEPRELVCVQLEKMIANACINPLTVIFRTLNGGLLSPLVAPLRKVLCQEASAVFMKYLESTVGLDKGLETRFEAERLERSVLDVTDRTSENKSSMYQDFDAGRETEVRYINGWFARVGRENGVDVQTHATLVELVEAKEEVRMEDIGEVFPKTL